MNLWRSRTEPTPPVQQSAECEAQRQIAECWADEQQRAAQALADVKVREIAAESVRQASALCEALDAEFKSWQLRRDQATRQFYDALAENKRALDERNALTKQPVRPVAVATGRVGHAS